MKIRKHIYFSGMVQGVGFRYRAHYIAESLGITGWVRNLADDRVEMEAQGDGEAICKMINMLSEARFIHITNLETEDRPLEKRESSFKVIGY